MCWGGICLFISISESKSVLLRLREQEEEDESRRNVKMRRMNQRFYDVLQRFWFNDIDKEFMIVKDIFQQNRLTNGRCNNEIFNKTINKWYPQQQQMMMMWTRKKCTATDNTAAYSSIVQFLLIKLCPMLGSSLTDPIPPRSTHWVCNALLSAWFIILAARVTVRLGQINETCFVLQVLAFKENFTINCLQIKNHK